MNRRAQAVVLFLIGMAVLHAALTGLYLRYVKAGLRPLLITAGAALIATAVVTAWYDLRRRARHDHREPRVSWLLILPLLALILIAPPALGSYSAGRTGTVLPQPPGFPTLPAGNPLQLTVLDYAGRAVYDHGHSLGTRRITLTGFVALDGHGTYYLTRMVLNCCAADAQPVKVGLTGQVPPVLQPDAWLTVVGTYTARETRDPLNRGIIPYIQVSQAKQVPAPSDPYES